MWNNELRPTNMIYDGEQVYINVNIRPAWFWTIRRFMLFFGIVWREWDDFRISIRTAWEVSKCAVGTTR